MSAQEHISWQQEQEREHALHRRWRRRRLIARLRRFGRRVLMSMALTLGLVWLTGYAIMRFEPTRFWLRDIALSVTNARLEGRLEVDDFGGNLLGGITLQGVRLLASGDTVLVANSVLVRYDLQALLTGGLVINRIGIDKPFIKILRSRSDSSWNVAHIVQSTNDSTVQRIQLRKLFNVISVRDVNIMDATVIVQDSLAQTFSNTIHSTYHNADSLVKAYHLPQSIHPQRIHLAHCRFDSCRLSIAATLRPQEHRYAFTLNHCSLRDEASHFVLRNCSFGAAVDTNHAELFNLRAVTAESSLRLDAVIDSVNVFTLNSSNAAHKLRSKPVQISLNADSVSARDLQRFSPMFDVLGGKPAIRLELRGTMNDLALERVWIGSAPSNALVWLDGRVQHLNEVFDAPERVHLQATFRPTRIPYGEVERIVPALATRGITPRLTYLGTVVLDRATFTGTLTAFHTTLKAASAVGGVEADLHIDRRSDTVRYEAVARTAALNLAPILGNAALESALNTAIYLKGQGLTLQTLSATARVESNSSVIARRAHDYALVNLSASNGVFTLENAKIQWNRRPEFDEYHYDDAQLSEHALKPSQILASGSIDLSNPLQPSYRLEARAFHLDLMNIVPETGVQSDATMKITVTGRGVDMDSLQGNVNIIADEFFTPSQAFEPFVLNMRLERTPDGRGSYNRLFQLSSDFADATVRGEFTPGSFVRSFAAQVDNVIYQVRRKYHLIRDSASAPVWEGLYHPTSSESVPLDVEFSLRPRDLSLLALFTGDVKILGEGELRGSIRGSTRQYQLRIDSSRLASFRFTDGLVNVQFRKALVAGEFYNGSFADSLNTVGAWAVMQCDTFAYDDWVFRNARAQARYDSERFVFDVRSDYKNLLRFAVRGELDVSSANATLWLDTATVGYGKHWWANEGKIDAVLNQAGLQAQAFTLRRVTNKEYDETLSLSGIWWFDRFVSAQAVLHNLPLHDVHTILPQSDQTQLWKPLYGIVRELRIGLDGLWTNPTITATMNADSLAYNGAMIGDAVITAIHRDSTITGNVECTSLLKRLHTTRTDNAALDHTQILRPLVINVRTFPLNLALVPTEERIVDNRPIDIRFDAEQFPLSALAQFIPAVNSVRGIVQAHFSITGTTYNNINYRGDASISQASMVVDATNLRYFANANLTLNNDVVNITALNVRNDSLDYPRGRASATGWARLKGFAIDTFDLSVRSPSLLVLADASRITHPNLYGDVVIQTGVQHPTEPKPSEPLHCYGTLEKPFLRGDVNILEASIVLPDMKSVKTEYRAFCFETQKQENGRKIIIGRDCSPNEYARPISSEPMKPTATAVSATTPSITTLNDLEHYQYSTPEYYTAHHLTATSTPDTNATFIPPNLPANLLGLNTLDTMLKVENLGNERRFLPQHDAALMRSSAPTASTEQGRRTIAERSFADKIDYDLNVKLKGNFFITMDFSFIDQLVATIAQEDPTKPLRYVQTPDNPDEPQLFGTLRVREGSKYNFYRLFNTTGTMAFTTGSMDNPQLNLNATLRGQRLNPTGRGTDEYTVLLELTGTKRQPNVKISYFIGNQPGLGDPVKVQSDAIMLMIFGRTQDELALQGIGRGVGEATVQGSSSAASKVLTDILQGTGIIRSADIYFSSSRTGNPLDLSQARVQLTGEISDLGVVWQASNDIGADNALNPSFTIDVPLRAFLNQELFRNIVLQVTRSVVNANVLTRQQRELEVKLSVQHRW
jgi:hypothetical protein